MTQQSILTGLFAYRQLSLVQQTVEMQKTVSQIVTGCLQKMLQERKHIFVAPRIYLKTNFQLFYLRISKFK